MTNVEQLICEIFILDSYFIIFMLRKDNDVSLIYLISSLEILSAKIIENDVVLF